MKVEEALVFPVAAVNRCYSSLFQRTTTMEDFKAQFRAVLTANLRALGSIKVALEKDPTVSNFQFFTLPDLDDIHGILLDQTGLALRRLDSNKEATPDDAKNALLKVNAIQRMLMDAARGKLDADPFTLRVLFPRLAVGSIERRLKATQVIHERKLEARLKMHVSWLEENLSEREVLAVGTVPKAPPDLDLAMKNAARAAFPRNTRYEKIRAEKNRAKSSPPAGISLPSSDHASAAMEDESIIPTVGDLLEEKQDMVAYEKAALDEVQADLVADVEAAARKERERVIAAKEDALLGQARKDLAQTNGRAGEARTDGKARHQQCTAGQGYGAHAGTCAPHARYASRRRAIPPERGGHAWAHSGGLYHPSSSL